jgi:pimeloyl-ACP methyl ester carboxylesterase
VAHKTRVPHARSGDLEIAYEATGDGAPLVLVAGIGMQLVHWQPRFCEALAGRGFRVVRFDHRDVGLSTKLTTVPRPRLGPTLVRGFLGFPVEAPYTLREMAGDLFAVLDALGIARAHLVGMSMGGMVAQTAALLAPERVLSLTSMMSNTGDRLDSVAHPRAALALLSPVPRDRAGNVERLLRFFRTVAGPRYPIDEAALRESAGLAYDRCFHPRGFLHHFAAVLASPTRTAALAKLRLPALVIHGTADPLIRVAGGHRTARAIPGARLRLIDGLGHHFPEAVWPIVLDEISAIAARAKGWRGD